MAAAVVEYWEPVSAGVKAKAMISLGTGSQWKLWRNRICVKGGETIISGAPKFSGSRKMSEELLTSSLLI